MMKDAVMRTKPGQSCSLMIAWERLRMIVSRSYRDLWQLGNKGKNMKSRPKHAETSQNKHRAYDDKQAFPLTLDVWLSRNFRRRRPSVPVFYVSI